MNEPTEAHVETLMDDLRAVAASAEALLAVTASDASERVRDARRRASESLERARARLHEVEESVKVRAHEVDRYVHENPWPAIAGAAAVGALIGLLLGRR